MQKYNLHASWEDILKLELKKDYFKRLISFVDDEYKTSTCYPPKQEIFAAFNACPFDKVKVVIIGQDPYHGFGQANGLCFSVNSGVKHPPSLVNIFKELQQSSEMEYPKQGNLMSWAKQGVLLLNATLTVEEGKAGSHQKKGWEQFTDAVIQVISHNKNDVIFLLWGGYAHKKEKIIDTNKHTVLKTGHPSPLSANRGYWFGNNHFNEANKVLISNKLTPILWDLN